MITAREYQTDLIAGAYEGWGKGQTNQLIVAPTGAGKSYTLAFIARDYLSQYRKPVVVMAHRDVLLSQLSMSMATIGVPHDLICNAKTKRFIGDLHVKKLGRSFYSPGAPTYITSVDTLVRRDTSNWGANVGMWIMDEAHHILRENKWGKCVEKFPCALGLGVTATPLRGDGRGLGSAACGGEGVFDNLVERVTMSDLIGMGNLTNYTVAISPMARDIMHSMANIGHVGGDFNPKEAAALLDKKYITGDVVSQYKKTAMGHRGITFGQNIEHCIHLADAYNAAGVPAIALSSKNSDSERWEALGKFERGEILQLVNCALFDEGFDVPACVSVSMVCATESYGKYAQQFGRSLRPAPGKSHAIINDHVGNVLRHRTPDAPRIWTLANISKRNDTKSEIKDTSCLHCLRPYEKNLINCPYCGEPNDLLIPKPGGTSSVSVVAGELIEMSREELQQLWGKKSYVDTPSSTVYSQQIANGHPAYVAGSIAKVHEARLQAHTRLRGFMTGYFLKLEREGCSVDQARLKFARVFGIDVLSAQILNERDTNVLTERIINNEE